jgi:bacillolysin
MQSTFDPLTMTELTSRPSVSDNGFEAFFVAGDSTLRSIITSPEYLPEEDFLQDDPEHIFGNVVLSKDGNRIAAVTAFADTTIWLYDYNLGWKPFILYNPTYWEGVTAAGVLYADALEFDISGEFLVYDAFNTLKNKDGEDIEYWDVNFIRVWDNAANTWGDGTIYKLFSSIPEGVSIGNPSFSKNSPNIIAFDYWNSSTEEYAVLSCNIETNEVNVIAENNNLGYPSFNKEDTQVAFTSANGDDYSINYVTLNADKITSDGSIINMFTGGAWPVYFATGIRNAIRDNNRSAAGLIINSYPNPFTASITLKIPQELSEKCKLEIFSPAGQVVFSGFYNAVEKNALTLDLKGLPAGYYVLRLRNDKIIASGRILKIK